MVAPTAVPTANPPIAAPAMGQPLARACTVPNVVIARAMAAIQEVFINDFISSLSFICHFSHLHCAFIFLQLAGSGLLGVLRFKAGSCHLQYGAPSPILHSFHLARCFPVVFGGKWAIFSS
jgi:hypothetical protein